MRFGTAEEQWGSYTYADPGQTAPTASVTADGNGIHIQATFVPESGYTFEGVGLYFSSQSCIDGSRYTGIQFGFAGDLGGCSLNVGVTSSADISSQSDPARGACSGTPSTCYGPFAPVQPVPAVRVPFSAMSGGMPMAQVDPSTITNVNWQLSGPASAPDGGDCSADITVENVTFY
jgi:hypothetical protein